MLVTHAHRGHYTLAVDIRRRGRGATIRIGAEERTSMRELTQRAPYAMPHQVPILRAAGAPDSVLKAIEEIDFPFDRSEWELPDAWLRDDEVITLPAGGTLRAVHTPGHTSGHMVFLDEERKLLFGGDHVLPHITPSIGYEQVPSPQPLRAFLQSLDRLTALPDAELLPGHGPAGMSVHARVAELIRHHERRLEETLRAVESGAASAREVAERLRWTRRGVHLYDLDPFNQALAMVETIAHLDLLVLQGSLSVDKTTVVQRYGLSTRRPSCTLRRSNAYTVADFAQARYDSLAARRTFTVCVCLVCSLYIVPQLHGAALVASTVLGVPAWVGPALVAVVVALIVVSGGMRSITMAQAPQYWIKVISFLVPLLAMAAVLHGGTGERAGSIVVLGGGDVARSPYWTISLLTALLLGAAGLPHVLVRFCTSPDGRTAQRTARLVLVLVGAFYVLPVAYGVLGRRFAAGTANTDTLVLVLPAQIVKGSAGQVLTAVVAAGVFSALLATSSGLIVTVAGVVSQELFGADIRGFRWAALGATGLTLMVALATESTRLTDTVGHVFAFSASTIFPALVLGIWTRSTTATGVVAGMVVGGVLVIGSALAYYRAGRPDGVVGDLLGQPAGWTVPVVGAVIVAVSLLRPPRESRALSTERFPQQLHCPDERRATDRAGG